VFILALFALPVYYYGFQLDEKRRSRSKLLFEGPGDVVPALRLCGRLRLTQTVPSGTQILRRCCRREAMRLRRVTVGKMPALREVSRDGAYDYDVSSSVPVSGMTSWGHCCLKEGPRKRSWCSGRRPDRGAGCSNLQPRPGSQRGCRRGSS